MKFKVGQKVVIKSNLSEKETGFYQILNLKNMVHTIEFIDDDESILLCDGDGWWFTGEWLEPLKAEKVKIRDML